MAFEQRSKDLSTPYKGKPAKAEWYSTTLNRPGENSESPWLPEISFLVGMHLQFVYLGATTTSTAEILTPYVPHSLKGHSLPSSPQISVTSDP